MLAMLVFAARVLRPATGVLDGVLVRSRNGWAWQTRYVWYATVVCLPAALGVLAAMGYFYSALQLERRLVVTVWLILGLIVFNGLVLRWLVIVKRSLALEEAKSRRTATTPEPGASGVVPAAEGPLVVDQPKIDINVVSAQTRRLLHSALVFGLVMGVWFIWIDLLPALGVLERVEIWPTMQVVPSEPQVRDIVGSPLVSNSPTAVSAATQPTITPLSNSLSIPTVASSTPQSEDPLTLLEVLTSLVLLLAMFAIARNIPGLLEVSVLQWFTMEPSARYATATIVRYLIVIVGLGLAFHFIGIGWSKVQWLAAAITLGVGFGLQEIFANFISGLILLFEQPIRVGDTVTVNGVDGTVTRIRMRATTITDYDRKELVIPNKDFITGQIVNWTLTDAVTRMTFPVGVAYGTDTATVERTLLKIAKTNPLVLEDPAPQAVFTGFGDSTLNFSFRVFLPNLDNALRTRHEINTAIERAFREAGIEIAFPQRDIHIRSTPNRPMQLPATDSGQPKP
jgi:potassium efflux system protein